MSPQELLQAAAAVREAHKAERRAKAKLLRVDTRIAAGDEHLADHRASLERQVGKAA